MSVLTSDGDEITAFGNKSAVGLNSTLTEFIINSTDGRQTFTKMDSQGRVESASDSDGNEMTVKWEDNNTIASFEVLHGSEQLILSVDLTTVGDANTTDPPAEVEERRKRNSNSPFSHDRSRIRGQSCTYISTEQG